MNILECRLKEKYPDEDLAVLQYTIMKGPAIVKCNVCGSTYSLAKAESFIRKDKKCVCRKCVNNHSGKRLSLVDIQKRIDEKYPKEKLKIVSYTLTKEPCDIQCLTCGNIYHFEHASSAYFTSKRRVCSYCFPNKREQMQHTLQNFKRFMQQNNDFVLVNDLNNIDVRSHTLVQCKCKKCGKINKKTVYDYLNGRGCTCEGNNTLLTQQEYQAELGDEYTLLSEYQGREHSVKIRHNLCGFCYKANARHYTCPKCSGSKGEKAIAFWLEQRGIAYYKERKENIEGHQLRFDFYLPDFNVYIEYQGTQHFIATPYFGGEEKLHLQQLYDSYKINWCSQNSHNLLVINYYENIQNKLEQYLLKFNDYPEREYTQASGSGNSPSFK